MVISHRLSLTIRPVEHTASSFADCSAGVLHPKQPGLLQRYLRAVRRTWLLQSPRWATPVLHAGHPAQKPELSVYSGCCVHPASRGRRQRNYSRACAA